MSWSFKEIIDAQPRLDDLLKKLKLPIDNDDWIHRAFTMLDGFEKVRMTGDCRGFGNITQPLQARENLPLPCTICVCLQIYFLTTSTAKTTWF